MALERKLNPYSARSRLARALESASSENFLGIGGITEAFLKVPREFFVDEAFFPRAYEDTALPIGFEQTISRPSTVYSMLVAGCVGPGTKVLEVGSGSGYVLALLGAIGAEACGIERLAPLARGARKRLDFLGHEHILIKVGDGRRGWRERGPFDVIIVSAALPEIPLELVQQLAEDGRLIAPVGDSHQQRLVLCTASNVAAAVNFTATDLGPCQFVIAA